MEQTPPLVTPIFDLVLCLSRAIDLVSPLVANHHQRTALVACGLGLQMHLPEEELRDLVIAAALHDVGGLTRQDRLDTLDFEFNDPLGHSVRGYLLLKPFAPFEKSAEMIRFHHVPWQHGAGAVFAGQPVPRGSHLLHLADRLAVLLDPAEDVLEQASGLMDKILAQSGDWFDPAQVQALQALAQKEAFWLDAISLLSLNFLDRRLDWPVLEINQAEFLGMANLFRRIIDFRSPFTATHTAGVAAVAQRLGRLSGFSEAEGGMLYLAGLLHDLGKLAVPTEILEKPGKLTHEEFSVIRRHTYYTFHILEPLHVLDTLRIWGAFHHERMDGGGYPFHLSAAELPLGSRMVSVADIFTALTEERPYRKGLLPGEAVQILSDASLQHRVDEGVVAILRNHLAEIDQARSAAQLAAEAEYRQFLHAAKQLSPSA